MWLTDTKREDLDRLIKWTPWYSTSCNSQSQFSTATIKIALKSTALPTLPLLLIIGITQVSIRIEYKKNFICNGNLCFEQHFQIRVIYDKMSRQTLKVLSNFASNSLSQSLHFVLNQYTELPYSVFDNIFKSLWDFMESFFKFEGFGWFETLRL